MSAKYEADLSSTQKDGHQEVHLSGSVTETAKCSPHYSVPSSPNLSSSYSIPAKGSSEHFVLSSPKLSSSGSTPAKDNTHHSMPSFPKPSSSGSTPTKDSTHHSMVVEEGSVMMEKLPLGVSSNIFARLPGDTIFKCTLVSKAWCNLTRDIIHSPGFDQLHLQFQNHHWGFLWLLRPSKTVGDLHLHLAEVYENNNHNNCICRANRICTPYWPYDECWRIVGSCHGLICLAKSDLDSVLVYNPLLKEYIYLPDLSSDLSSKVSPSATAAMGFGFNPTSKVYTIVRIFYRSVEVGVGHVSTYTLGRGSWEYGGTTTYQLKSSSSTGVPVNGSVHWLTHLDSSFGFNHGSTIVSFDMSSGVFSLIPLPDGVTYRGEGDDEIPTDIKEFGGVLCLFQKDEDAMNLWILRGGDWVMKKVALRWWLFFHYEPCAFMRNDAQVLVSCTNDKWQEESGIFFVHEQLQLFDAQAVLGPKEDDALFEVRGNLILTKRGYKKSQVVGHVNSFVSLESLGEIDVKIVAEEGEDIPSV